MSDREKEIIENLLNSASKLDREDQKYLIGIAEGMALAREMDQEAGALVEGR